MSDGTRETMALPVSSHGRALHVGDRVCGVGDASGRMHVQAIINGHTVLVGPKNSRWNEWVAWPASECEHYERATKERVIHALVKEACKAATEHCADGITTEGYLMRIRGIELRYGRMLRLSEHMENFDDGDDEEA